MQAYSLNKNAKDGNRLFFDNEPRIMVRCHRPKTYLRIMARCHRPKTYLPSTVQEEITSLTTPRSFPSTFRADNLSSVHGQPPPRKISRRRATRDNPPRPAADRDNPPRPLVDTDNPPPQLADRVQTAPVTSRLASSYSAFYHTTLCFKSVLWSFFRVLDEKLT